MNAKRSPEVAADDACRYASEKQQMGQIMKLECNRRWVTCAAVQNMKSVINVFDELQELRSSMLR